MKGYKGAKHTVYELDDATRDEIIAADTAQWLEFPRGPETEVPVEIEHACYEVAYALLEGVDQETQVENLSVVSDAYSRVRNRYGRSTSRTNQIINGIPSMIAWKLLKPFLVDTRITNNARS